jgi:hypothetical protein
LTPNPKRSAVCFGKSPTQLIGELRQPVKGKPGQLERLDCKYKRNGKPMLGRIDSRERLVAEIAARERQRKTSRARIKWMFTTEKARPPPPGRWVIRTDAETLTLSPAKDKSKRKASQDSCAERATASC